MRHGQLSDSFGLSAQTYCLAAAQVGFWHQDSSDNSRLSYTKMHPATVFLDVITMQLYALVLYPSVTSQSGAQNNIRNFEAGAKRMLRRQNPSRYCSQEQGISKAWACCMRGAPCMMEGGCKERRPAAHSYNASAQVDQQANPPVQAKCPSIIRTASILHGSSCARPACIPTKVSSSVFPPCAK